jgi:hypothetical protein
VSNNVVHLWTLLARACCVMLVAVLAAATPAGAQQLDPGVCPDTPTRTARPQYKHTNEVYVAPSLLEYDLKPGEVTRACLLVGNRQNTSVAIRLVAVDVEAGPDENNPVQVVPESSIGLASWLRFPARRAVLRPGDEFIFPYEIHVPHTPSVGTSQGAIQVWTQAPGARDSVPGTDDEELLMLSGSGVAIRTALVAQLSVTVPGRIAHDLDVKLLDAPHIMLGSSRTRYSLLFHNGGNVIEHATPKISISSSLGGRRVLDKRGEELRLLRDGRRQTELSWSDPPWVGRFKPTLTVTTDQGPRRVHAPTVWILPPWWFLVGLLIAIGVPIGQWLISRRSNRVLEELQQDRQTRSDEQASGPGFELDLEGHDDNA